MMRMKPPPLYVTMVPGFAKPGLQEMMPQELYFHPSLDVLDIRSVGAEEEVLPGLSSCFGLILGFCGFFYETLDMAARKHQIESGRTPVVICRNAAREELHDPLERCLQAQNVDYKRIYEGVLSKQSSLD